MLTGGIIYINYLCVQFCNWHLYLLFFHLLFLYPFFSTNIPIFFLFLLFYMYITLWQGWFKCKIILVSLCVKRKYITKWCIAVISDAFVLAFQVLWLCRTESRSESVARMICMSIKTRAFEVAKFNWRVAEIVSRTWDGNVVYIFMKHSQCSDKSNTIWVYWIVCSNR